MADGRESSFRFNRRFSPLCFDRVGRDGAVYVWWGVKGTFGIGVGMISVLVPLSFFCRRHEQSKGLAGGERRSESKKEPIGFRAAAPQKKT